MSRHSHNKGKEEWHFKIVWYHRLRPFEVTVVGKFITHSLQNGRTVICAVVFLSSYLSLSVRALSPLSLCDWEHFNDRNLVLLNSAAWSDTDAKTFQELVVFPSGSPAPLSPPLYSPCIFSVFTPLSSFSVLSPPLGECQRERERKRSTCVSIYESLCFCFPACSVFVLNVPRKTICTVIQAGLHCTVHIPALFSLLNKPHHFTTPNYHSLHVKATTHYLIQYLISLLHVMSPCVSNHAMVEFGTDQRMQR